MKDLSRYGLTEAATVAGIEIAIALAPGRHRRKREITPFVVFAL